MVAEVLQNYVNLVSGLGKMTRDKALATARTMLSAAGLEDVANDATGRVSKLAEEIMLANRANRELVENLIAAEVDRAAARLGFVRTDDLEALREEVDELRRDLVRSTAGAPPAAHPGERARRPSSTGPAGQQPPLGGTPEATSAPAGDSELIPSGPLPYEPGPIQPNAVSAERAAARKSAGPGPSPATAPAKKSSARKTAAQKKATQGVPPSPVADGEVAE